MVKEDFITKEPYVSAEPLYKVLNESSKWFKIFCVIKTAVDIHLFDNLVDAKGVKELCATIGTDYTLTYSICNVLSELGLIEEQNGLYRNTETTNLYLRTDSPLAQRSVIDNLERGFELWKNLDEMVRHGPVRASFEPTFINALASWSLCGELQRTIKIIAELPEFKRARRLLDLAGGHGLYAIAFTKLNPNLEAYVFDLPEVIKQTRTYISGFNADRVGVIAGDLFSDNIGTGYDIVFFSYNPGGKNPRLVPKIYSSLNRGGIFITKHAFYHENEGSKNPLLDIEWNLTTWEGVKKGGKIYSFEGDLSFEAYIELLERYFSIVKIVDATDFAGFPLTQFGDTLDSKIIVAKKK